MIRLKSLLKEQGLPDFDAATEYVLQNPIGGNKVEDPDRPVDQDETPVVVPDETSDDDRAWKQYELVDYNMLMKYVKLIVNLLDGWVTESDYEKVYYSLKKYAYDADEEIQKVVLYRENYYDALQFLAWSYSMDESGDSLYNDINTVGMDTFSVSFIQNQVEDMKQLLDLDSYTKDDDTTTKKPEPLNISSENISIDLTKQGKPNTPSTPGNFSPLTKM